MKLKILFVFLICFIFKSHGQKDHNLFLIDSLKQKVLNQKFLDSTLIANTHYRIGELYRYSAQGDSSYHHYYKAEKIYRRKRNKFQLARTLYGISAILTNEKYYTGAETASFEAIALLETLDKNNEVRTYESYIYNNLGITFRGLDDYEKSIIYHKKGLNLKMSLNGNNEVTISKSKNNLANAYRDSGQYNLAKELFNDLLKDKSLLKDRPDFYALVLDNYAYLLYLSKKYDHLPKLYFRALRICDSINNISSKYNSISVNQNIAEYYNDFNKIDLAKHYAYKAKEISEEFDNDGLLNSLLLLSKIEEGDKAFKHLNTYVKLNDSLQKKERATRNKFERIRFETNQIEKENVKIAKERMWLLIISVVLIIASLLLYIIINQRTKNKELQFIQQQQETNEEIYNLMLSEQDNIEEARVIEKKRISEELHDGVLGRLFGTRLSLDSLNMATSEDAINTRSQYISELKTIEEDIRKVSHELNTDFVSGSGFIDIINNLVETQTLAYQLKYKLNQDGAINWDGVSNKNKIHIYRIIQEALHNIHKHAEATIVTISFKLKKSLICLNIVDDGSGFDVNKAKSGIGLKNINSRTAEINGIIKIKSEINEGTTVTIEIPIT
ncbi:MAG: tetratricopeptide repeat protein [Algibacter sp.]